MQNVDVTNFTNSSGWHVSHNSKTMQYEIKAESNGKLRPGSWTHRRFADKALYDYLAHIQRTSPNELKKTKTSKSVKKELMKHVNS